MSTEELTSNGSGVEEEEQEITILTNSIENSRKRHLSEGLLRGDKVADDLAVQEASASPLLKKTRITNRGGNTVVRKTKADMALSSAEFHKYMDGLVVNRLDALDSGLSVLKGDLSKVNRKVDANAVKIGEQSVSITTNKGNIAKLQSEIEKLKEAPAFPALPSPTNPWPTPTDARSGPDAAYLLARRSLRLWPIGGMVTEKIWESTGEFLEVHIGLNDRISEPMIERIYRPDVPSGPGAKMEAVVVFKDPSTRDTVIGSTPLIKLVSSLAP